MEMNIEILLKQFKIDGKLLSIDCNNTGNINKTYIITMKNNNKIEKYVLQEINTNVFNEPYLLMNNIVNVTEYCKNYLIEHNMASKRNLLSVIKTKESKNLLRTYDNRFYRMYNFIDNAVSYDISENCEMFYKVGTAVGEFVKMLDGYPMDILDETILNFHNTLVRYNDFINSVKKDACNRVKNVKDEINFIISRKDYVGKIINLINKGEIPIRVTHNDTKINNVLFDKYTGENICMIDLDTVMPGSALYDFGDAIRSGAAKTIEDDPNLETVGINIEYFKSFTEAYLKETNDILTEAEINNLAFSCILLTFELAIRFLTDYINGDTYFKCNYDNHNLDRTRNQLALVSDMEKHYEEMKTIVNEILKDINNTKKLSLDNKNKLN